MITDSIKKLIAQEIEWCKKNPSGEYAEFRFAFIKGLKQAVTLIEQLESKVAYMSDTDDVLAAKIAEAVVAEGQAELNTANWIEAFKKANAEKRKARRELREIKQTLIFKNATTIDECVYCGHSKMAHSTHGCRQPLRHGHCDCGGFLPKLNIH